jgi:hypothetical protein
MNKTMRSAVALVAGWGLVGLAMPASATLNLLVTVNKDKDVNVLVDLQVQKFINIDVALDRVLDGAAEAHALANVTNVGNLVGACGDSCPLGPAGGEEGSYNIDLHALLNGSVQDNDGIVGVNQDVGNMVNQANILAMARTEFTDEARKMVSDAEASVDQVNAYNVATQYETLPEGDLFLDPDHSAIITDSITGNDGVIGVNQSSGNMNNQTNAVGMVIGAGNSTVLTDANLGQYNGFNTVKGVNTVKVDLISSSINDNNGVVSVNQSAGNMNNQGSVIAFGALTTTATIGVPGS